MIHALEHDSPFETGYNWLEQHRTDQDDEDVSTGMKSRVIGFYQVS